MYDTLEGMQKTLVYTGVREGVVAKRQIACWCPACMFASAPGEGTMNTSFTVAGCAVNPEFGMDADGRRHRHTLADLVEQLHDQDELDELLAVYETGLHECMRAQRAELRV